MPWAECPCGRCPGNTCGALGRRSQVTSLEQSGWLWVDFGGCMRSRVSCWTCHEPWLESRLWAVGGVSSIGWVPVTCQALCWPSYHPPNPPGWEVP